MDERFELTDQRACRPLCKIRVDPPLQTGQLELFEPRDLGLRESLVREVRERAARATARAPRSKSPSEISCSTRVEVELARSDASSYPGGRVRIRSLPSALRSCETYTWRAFVRSPAGARPRATRSGRPSRRRGSRSGGGRPAAHAACAAPSSIVRPLSRTSSGPRMRNSTATRR